ncbi:MAG: tRNA pseudouridine synthase [Moraxellaceae bacterium]|jgi:tRNA pseudouridine55 synthase|nr:tRNA pseudouridine synthase [Moraxellaceae bacterium]
MSKPRRPRRPVHGIVLLDKPQGLTSNQALQRVRHMYQADKAGHTGSLDPLATGLLPICLGEASKFTQYLLEADKVYRTRIRLGVKTATGDSEGDVIATAPVPALTLDEIEQVLARFRGEIDQVPSMFSALKKDGRPLYELARKGIEVERPARRVTIHRLELLGVDGPEWELEAHVSKGTYIRSLAEDIGEALGCGAHVVMLRRLSLGPFDQPAMLTLEQIEAALADGGHAALDALLLPPWAGLVSWPRLDLSEAAAYYLLHGQAVRVAGAPQEGGVLLFEEGGRFLGIGEMDDEARVAPKRLIRFEN